MGEPSSDDPLYFILDLADRLGSAKTPWSVKRGRTHYEITNDQAVLVADCYDAAGIVPELIVRMVNALPLIAAELTAARLEARRG